MRERFSDPEAPQTAESARELARARARLVELGAPDETLHWVAMWAAEALRVQGLNAQAQLELEFVIARPSFTDAMRNSARIELAHSLLPRQELALVDELLASSESTVRHSTVARIVASDDALAPEELSASDVGPCLDAMRWFSARTLLELQMGRPDRAEDFLVGQERLAQVLAGPFELWEAFDSRMRMWLTLNDTEELLRFLDQPRTTEILAAIFGELPHLRVDVEQRRATAQYERCRKLGLDPSGAVAVLLASMRDETSNLGVRLDAARRIALVGCDRREPALTREALTLLRADAAARAAATDPTREAVLHALELAATLDEPTDAAKLRANVDALEASLTHFAAHWQRVSRRRMGLSYLRSGDRHLVPSELLRGCVALEGADVGGRRALRGIHRLQMVGGLANTIFADRPAPEFDSDVRDLCENGAGILLYVPGRTTSHAVLVDATHIEIEELASNVHIVDDCTEFANAAADAVHRLADVSDPTVVATLRKLSQRVLGPRARACLERWSRVTLIGDESFGHIPLALFEADDGSRWGERIAINYAPSLPIAAELTRRARAAGRRESDALRTSVLALPTPPPTGAWPAEVVELSVPHERLEAWSETLAGGVECFLGTSATPARLTRDDARPFDLMQIVAHGTRDRRRECSNGFLLHAESAAECAVWAEQVEQTRAARVTSLAICSAADRTSARGDDGRTGLAASFVIAGSDCVLQTPTDLEATAAVDLFERVCSLITHGAAPAEALAQTRRERAERGQSKLQDYLVYAWGAGLVPVAEPSAAPAPVVASRTNPRKWTAAAFGAAAVICVIAAWMWSRRKA